MGQRLDAALAGVATGDLGAQISGTRLRVADIGSDDVEDGAVGPAGLHQLQGRQDQPFLEDLPAVGRLGAGHLAADVDVMGDGRRNGDDLALMEDRAEEHDVRGMGTAAIGVVGDQHIALAPILERNRLQHMLGRQPHDAELGGDRLGLGQHLAIGQEQAAGIVVHVPDDRGIGRAPQRHGHLLGGAHDLMLEGVSIDGIDVHLFFPFSGPFSGVMASTPPASASAIWPGMTSTVVSS